MANEPPRDPEDDELVPRPDCQPFRAHVIDLAGVRVRWGLPPARKPTCDHTALVYNQQERRVWCENCRRGIENFDAFMAVVHHFEKMEHDAQRKIDKANEALKAQIHRRATKAVDKAWSRQGGMAISCPHCQGGLLPEDFTEGRFALRSRELELARREKNKK